MKMLFLMLILAGHSVLNGELLHKQRECNQTNEMHCRVSIPSELKNLPYGIYAEDSEYNTARLDYNKRFSYFPLAIFTPKTNKQAQTLLKKLKNHQLNFAIRSGGHCFEPGSLSSDFIFDLSHFNTIQPDIKNKEVYIGAGARLGDVIEKLGRLGFAIPTGTCPSVGVAGLALGGGIGFLCRPYGLTCDAIKSLTVLDAKGNIIEVNQQSYPDLFWAMRGAGNGSYGIVLGLTFHMVEIPIVTFYELSWEWDFRLIPDIFETWQHWVQDLPDTITSVLGIRHPQELCAIPDETAPLVIRVHGLKIGKEPFNEWKKAFKHLKPKVQTFTGSYLEISKYWAVESSLPFNKNKSRILMKPVNKKVIMEVTRFFEKLEEINPDFVAYFNFEVLGGAVRNGDTAFFPREAFGWWQQAYFWDIPELSNDILALSQKFYDQIPNEVSKLCYANMVDYTLGRKYLPLYYGTHVDRLIKIKNKYDPTNLFHWKQSIPTRRNGSK